MAEVNKDTQNTNNYITKDDLVEFADKYAPQGTNTNYSLTFHNIKYEVTVPDGSGTKKEEKELTLTQGSSSDLPNQKDAEDNASQVAALITSVSYHKEIYQPGCLEVVIETKAALSYFSGLVTLKCINDSIASKYYIFEKKKKSGYVTLKAYSVDKFLTIDQFCQAFTGKKLVEEIIATTIDNCKEKLNNIKLFCDNITNSKDAQYTYMEPNLRHLCTDTTKKEPCIPYCVQYNESFYDFLVRMCNRNGEFLFCEDNKLYVGLPAEKDKPATISESDNDENSTGYEIEYNENYTDISNTAGNIVLNSLDASNGWPQAAAPGTLQSSRGIYPEEYNTKISDNFVDINDIQSLSSNILTGAKSIFGSRTVYEGVTAAIAAIGVGMVASGVFTESLKKKHKKFYDNVTYQFSTSEKLLDDTFYQNILKKEEKASNGKVVVTSTSYKNHKLGDTVTIDNDKYVVCQIRGMAKNVDGLLQSDSGEEKIERYIEKFEMVLLPYDESGMAYPFPLLAKWVRTATPQRAKVTDNFDPDRLGRVRISYPWQCNDSLASPWVRIAYPMASDESGFMFTPNAGDEVLVDYENGNVERPYIVGSLYNKTTVPSWHAKTFGSTVKSITSAHGHHISFTDLPGSRFTANAFPGFSLLGKLGLLDSVDFLNRGDSKYLGGGFEIADQYGFYSIKGSTDSRNITISSPIGDIKLDAYSGITINAPSGDVNITGKNVKIEAKNNLSLISGANITTPYYWRNKETKEQYWKGVKAAAGVIAAKTLGIDLSLCRTFVETILKPIGGTMLIKSGRYMCIEAGEGKADIYKVPLKNYGGRFTSVIGHKTQKITVDHTKECAKSFYKSHKDIIQDINAFRETYRDIVEGTADRGTTCPITVVNFTNILTSKLICGSNGPIDAHINTINTINTTNTTNTINTINAPLDPKTRKSRLVAANKKYKGIKKNVDSLKERYKTLIDNRFVDIGPLTQFIDHPGDNMAVTIETMNIALYKDLLFQLFKGLGIKGIYFKETDYTITTDAGGDGSVESVGVGGPEPTFGNKLGGILGWSGFVENNVWTTADQGGILISAKQGSKLRLTENGWAPFNRVYDIGNDTARDLAAEMQRTVDNAQLPE